MFTYHCTIDPLKIDTEKHQAGVEVVQSMFACKIFRLLIISVV